MNSRNVGLILQLVSSVEKKHLTIFYFSVHGLSRDSPLVCLGCYSSLDEEDPLTCPGCGLPLCHESCQDSPQHQPECSAFQAISTYFTIYITFVTFYCSTQNSLLVSKKNSVVV